jgi:hypothetical protein
MPTFPIAYTPVIDKPRTRIAQPGELPNRTLGEEVIKMRRPESNVLLRVIIGADSGDTYRDHLRYLKEALSGKGTTRTTFTPATEPTTVGRGGRTTWERISGPELVPERKADLEKLKRQFLAYALTPRANFWKPNENKNEKG